MWDYLLLVEFDVRLDTGRGKSTLQSQLPLASMNTHTQGEHWEHQTSPGTRSTVSCSSSSQVSAPLPPSLPPPLCPSFPPSGFEVIINSFRVVALTHLVGSLKFVVRPGGGTRF